jgi:hypothetical protein
MSTSAVAQSFTLPYRRFSTCIGGCCIARLIHPSDRCDSDRADYKSAIQQSETLRYGRSLLQFQRA